MNNLDEIISDSYEIWFGSTEITKYFRVKDVKGRGLQDYETDIIQINGKDGGYLNSKRRPPRIITVEAIFSHEDEESLFMVLEQIDSSLDKGEVELIFSDEQNRVYYASYVGATEKYSWKGFYIAELKFLCSDVRKYGTLISSTVDNPTGPVNLRNEGTAPTPPNFKITLKAPTTHLDIIGENDYMRIGAPASVSVNPVSPRELILWDQMNNLTGWGTAQVSDVDGAVVGGTMKTNGYEFSASSFGSGSEWHGPALIKSIGQALTDFEVEFRVELLNETMSTVGRVELYLLDENKNAVGKLALKDNHTGIDGNYAEIRAGDRDNGHFLVSERGDKWTSWLNFDGLLRLSRKNNKWEAYVAKFVDGKHTARRVPLPFIDAGNLYTSDVSYVVVHIAAYGNLTPSPMNIKDLKVYKLNQVNSSQIENIGEVGDVFEFDHRHSRIFKNGEEFLKKDFGSRFFELTKGDNELVFSPPEVISKVESEWRNAYR